MIQVSADFLVNEAQSADRVDIAFLNAAAKQASVAAFSITKSRAGVVINLSKDRESGMLPDHWQVVPCGLMTMLVTLAWAANCQLFPSALFSRVTTSV